MLVNLFYKRNSNKIKKYSAIINKGERFMAKKTVGLNYKNAELSVNDNGDYILTEITKDEEKSYNLTILLDSLVGQYLDLGLKTVDEIQPDGDARDVDFKEA